MSGTRRGLALLVGAVCAAVFVVAAPPAFAAAPTVTSFTPTSGPPKTVVTVSGSGFTTPSKVTFAGGVVVTATVTSSTRLTVAVPSNAGSGKLVVTTAGGTVTSAAAFTVAPWAGLTTTAGPPTTPTTLKLAGFGAYEAVDLYIDTTDIALVSASGTGITSAALTVPASAAPGTHWFTAVGRHSGYSAQASFTVRTNWAQLSGGVAHRGVDPYENQLSPSTVGGLTGTWRSKFHDTPYTAAEPVVADGVVYQGFGDGTVAAFTAATGAVKWTVTLGGAVDTTAAVSGTTLFVGSEDHDVYALDTATGAVTWRVQTGAAVESSPTVVGTTVYVGSDDDDVYALDTATGAVRWTYVTGGIVLASPTVVDGVVYIGSEDDDEYALDGASGELVWRYGTGAAISRAAAVVDGRVYVASGRNVSAIRTSTGGETWVATTGGIIEGSPTVAAGRVYVGSDDGDLNVLDAGNGRSLALTSLTTDAVRTTPTYANGVVYVGIGTVTTELTAGGTVIGDLPASSEFGGTTVADGAVYILDFDDEQLVRYDLGVGSLATHAPAAGSLHPNTALRAR